jgi:hypothetical protein
MTRGKGKKDRKADSATPDQVAAALTRYMPDALFDGALVVTTGNGVRYIELADGNGSGYEIRVTRKE